MITINGLKVEQFVFSGGEVRVKLPKGLKAGPMEIVARLQSSDDLMGLLLILDSIKRHYGIGYPTITIPYLPYARQDRVCSHGESLGFEVIQNLLPSNLITYDVHNPEVLRDYNHNRSLLDIAKIVGVLEDSNTILVAPDSGATSKTKELAEYYGLDWLQGFKVRDPETGKLSGFGVTSADFETEGRHMLIVDDICDGGGTFMGLGAELQKLNPKTLSLYVTHGIFSRGFTGLEKMFDMIYTTDTLDKQWLSRPKLKVFEVVGKPIPSIISSLN